ncbi:MAG: replication initiation protein [Chitinivibrionia bacterium]|nr:replication initiation protein [Chitinivibrionia bacterium]
MLNKVKSDKVALKPNKLILAGQQMLPYQQKLFWAALSVLEFSVINDEHYGKWNDSVNNFLERSRLARMTFKFPVSKIFDNYESLKLTDNAEYKKEIEKKTSDIVRQVLLIKSEKSFKAISIMSYAEYIFDEETIYVRFSPDVIPILAEMFDEGFTKVHLINVMKLRSGYSMRIYEILMHIKNLNIYKNGYTLSIRDLYFLLGIDKNIQYKLYGDFKELLLRCRKEIREKTGLSFDFEEIKDGKKVDAIKFINVREDINFNKLIKQISLFDNTEITEKEIILSSNPNETFLLDVLENPQSYIVQESVKKDTDDRQLSLPITQSEIKSSIKNKFTEEQNEKLEEYFEGIFSADEIKLDYEFDYIEFYYKRAMELYETGNVKNFQNFYYNLMKKDKYKFYELKEKERQKKEAEEAQKKAQQEAKKKEQKEAKKKKAAEEIKYRRLEKVFDSIPEDIREKLLQEVYEKNSLYKSTDGKIGIFAKWAVAEMFEKNLTR